MIAAGGGDDARDMRAIALETFGVNQPAPEFEGAGWSMILVLDPYVRARTRGKQRPIVLWRARKTFVHDACRGLEIWQCEHPAGHSRTRPGTTPGRGPPG